MTYILVGIGGAFGSLIRYKLGKEISERSKSNFPIGTFIINISGAYLLGLASMLDLSENGFLMVADGFLGAYTTFSTFMYEGFNLFQENEKMNAFIYIFGSLLIGITGFILGAKTAKLI